MRANNEPGSEPVIIDDNRIVLMHYQLDNGFGEMVDTSLGAVPMTYMHNAGMLLPALERELTGRQKGDEFELAIYPEDGYGYRDEDLVAKMPRSAFDDLGELTVGMRVRDKRVSDESSLFTVLVIGDEEVTIDANHPLAGQVLHFRIAIVDVREPSAQELKDYLGEGSVWTPPWLDSETN